MEVNPDNMLVKSLPSFVFGGINEHAISAPITESFMIGKSLKDPNTLKGALKNLANEIRPNAPPVSASPGYRKSLALSLFYKFYLEALGSANINPLYQSGAVPYVRPVSQGSQSYSTDSSKYPVNQPLPKLTATLQASGEAEYTTDIPRRPGELAAAFVLTTQGNAKILSMETSEAMAVEGAVAIVSAKDIPQNGKNDFMLGLGGDPEIVFATDVSEYAGQAVGLALADTQEHALQMAKAVTLTYQTQGKQILTIQDAIDAKSFYDKEPDIVVGDADGSIKGSDHVVTGDIYCDTQYHFTMETQTAFVIPEDDGYTVYSSNQWAQLGQFAVAGILGIPENKVTVVIKRVGGAYGSKISRASQVAAACALGSYVTQRPVRLHMDLESNMKMVGKRYPYYAKYTVGCTKAGVLNGIKIDVYTDAGCSSNDSYLPYALRNLDNTYNCSNWSITQTTCRTHTPSNTYTRAPGYLPGVFIIESLMDDVATKIGMDVEEFKHANFYKKGDISLLSFPPKGQALTYCNIDDLWQQMMKTADVQAGKGKISDFNKANRWRKRGLSVVPLRYGLEWNGTNSTVLVSVYSGDGSVSVVHGGVEIGQGINTKVAQVTASTLGIPLSSVTVVPTNTFTSPNNTTTGGSVTSEINCKGALLACQSLKQRLDKVKEGLISDGVSDPTWLQIVQKAFSSGIDLSEKRYEFATNDINPEIDVGQVEGAFVMGLGYFLTERVVYDKDTGALLTHNTWEYKPPTTKDIPIDFRVELLKNAPNPLGILGSKAVGEPPLLMSSGVLFALKRAVESARHDAGNSDPFILNAPATVEATQQACLVDPLKFEF
ncbi:PREDICTED: xanthine dehydrogenase/oxidase-like [Amphimedon queenslandica]|uniref:Aldehyde oxidase/xanthine dehydrogenase a/b hammerhead domain-containing protein n=1 Tax=Amphimedon queenslandica TaxID=400682 RepID=A0AAN0JPK4_AMPQE|nr:PREDICTED: xanthine dehydrogenase/oxidase-like [Amphimedon queenslandica]|eukprot:XP_019858733.1 PREDICTED: xanthine dehydrogenase/oxidase-like [Amphimedon queenslandica]